MQDDGRNRLGEFGGSDATLIYDETFRFAVTYSLSKDIPFWEGL